ncbi:ROK family protein [Nocardioides sp. cx-173]|uniref:ROK family transcriptional regulator n=1 Tax=Nocardioides sp. cx-173 TaxID=2898796 RepID=UPI001E42B572|nr:ROK family protein [Nocardioides sp. cx-173]MCD4523370.1 ROK family protein [Nocardioides sp. cx-173]UGB42290.1 ROK family protein [Nocardioides sp. cx-173]
MTQTLPAASAEAATPMPTAAPPGGGDLLNLMLDGQPRTRADLIELTGLARSTVAGRIEGLLSVGLLQPSGQSRSTGGRPPTRFAFNPRAKLVLAADFGVTHGRAALTDLTATVLAEEVSDLDIAAGPEATLGWLVDVADRLLAQVGRRRSDLAGVGIGLPGPVEHQTGRPVKPPIMPGWDDFDVAAWVTERMGVPVLVDNDVNLMALGEHSVVYPQVEHLVFVKISTGIGAGIISGRRLHRGAQGSAGDLGHVQSPRGGDALCSCGNRGCLEAIASARTIAQELDPDHLGGADASRLVLERLSHGDRDAVAAIRRAGRDIGEVLASCVSLMNPSVIVLGGALGGGAPSLLAGVREAIYARSLPLATGELIVVPAQTGEHAGVIGAATMAVQQYLAPQSVDAMLANPPAHAVVL